MLKKDVFPLDKEIQGLHNRESADGSYWLLRARIELSVFSRNHNETLEKVTEKPRVNPKETVTLSHDKNKGGKKQNE